MTEQEIYDILEGLDVPFHATIEFLCDGVTMILADCDSGEIYQEYRIH